MDKNLTVTLSLKETLTKRHTNKPKDKIKYKFHFSGEKYREIS